MRKTKTLVIAIALLAMGLVSLAGCREEEQPPETGISYTTTIPPLGMILRELVGDRATVTVMLGPGDSPHTYEPRPSQIKLVEDCTAFFYCNDTLDAWAVNFGRNTRVAVFDLVPDGLKRELPAHGHDHGDHPGHEGHDHAGHDHGEHGNLDPHFWMSPRVVEALVPVLTEELVRLDKRGEKTYRANAAVFANELAGLQVELTRSLAPLNGETVLLFHPSTLYFLADYGLNLGGLIEAVPGQEPTPKYIAGLVETAKEHKIKAVFTEPQLPRAPAETIAEETRLPLFELDPLGGGTGRQTYAELINYNAETLLEALAQ